jgi:hypothetical protein
MTDITDQDRRDAREWAEDVAETFKYDDEVPRETRAAVNYILATVDAPEPTLADEIRGLPDFTMSGENCINDCHERADTIATRVDHMERDLTEVREALAVEGRRVEKIAQERDHFFRDVEDVRNWKERLFRF